MKLKVTFGWMVPTILTIIGTTKRGNRFQVIFKNYFDSK